MSCCKSWVVRICDFEAMENLYVGVGESRLRVRKIRRRWTFVVTPVPRRAVAVVVREVKIRVECAQDRAAPTFIQQCPTIVSALSGGETDNRPRASLSHYDRLPSLFQAGQRVWQWRPGE